MSSRRVRVVSEGRSRPVSALLTSYERLLEARTVDELQTELVRFAHGVGFPLVSASVVVDSADGSHRFITIDNVPEAYKQAFVDLDCGRRDPVMQHCKTRSVPIAWAQQTYVDAGQADLWEEQARYGYRSGICWAMHLPKGRHFIFGVDREEALPRSVDAIVDLMAKLQLFGVYAQEACESLVLTPVDPAPAPALTQRELECLRWTLEGKTAWELGQILNISEHTAVRHLANAMGKLDSVSKHQAVLKALRLDLIR